MPRRTDVLRVRLVATGGGKVKAEMLGVDDSFKRVEKSSTSLTSKVKSLSGVFSVLSAAAIGGALKSTLAFADGIDKAAAAAGVGTEFLQEMRFAGEQLGVSNKLVDEGFRRFTRRLGEFVNSGGGPAAKAIEQLGVSITDTNGKFRGSEVVFEDFAVAMQGLESDAERAAFAAQIFGDDAGPKLALLLNEGAAGIQNLRQEARDIGAVLSDDLIDNAVEAQDSLSKMGNVLKVQVTSALIQLAPAITAAADGFVTLAKAAREFFNIGLSPVEAYTKQLDVLAKRAEILRKRLESPLSKLFGQRDELTAELESINGQMVTLQQAIFDMGLLAEEEPLDDLGAAAGIEGVKELNTELAKIQDRLNPLQAKAKQYAEELAVITGSNLGLEQQAELVKKLDEEFAKATGGPNELKKSVKAVEKQVEQTGETAADALEQPFKNAAENIQREFGNTFTDIFRNEEIRFETFTDLIRDMFARLAGEIAALLVFRPSIISGGLGGLGLFGGGTAAGAAGGAGTAGAAGGIGGLLASGQGLGLASILGLTAGAGLLGTYAGGGFGSRAGLAGGLVGGGLGAYGGLLLGSATALGPLGIPLGALAGSFLGGGIGNLFGGGSNNTQRFAFSTGVPGARGVASPFGTLSIDRERGIDATAILEQLASIDKSLAGVLSDEQITRVAGALAGTGQAFNVNQFDNEPFDVVKTRLVRIIDSVAENTVASGLLDSIGRDPGNIDQLVGEAGRVLELINLFKDEGGELNAAEQALEALNQQFDEMIDLAEQLGFSLSDVEEKRQKALVGLVEDFNVSIRDQILAIQDPLQAALELEERAAQERLDNAEALGADLVEVERLNALKRKEILERFEPTQLADVFGSANSSIAKFLQSLRITGAGGLSVTDQTANAESLFNELLGAARTDPAARADLASLLPGLVELKREQLGSTAAFFEFTRFLESSLKNLVDQGDTVTTLKDIGAAITTGDNAIVATLRDEIGELNAEIKDLKDDLLLLTTRSTA